MKATKENNYLYNPILKERARKLRTNGTKAEAYLWKYILSNRIMGYKFLRQRPVLHYIADFMCPELFLIIEADGLTHYDEVVQKKDTYRQAVLENAGFKVLRFEDNVIINNIGFVTEIIRQEILELSEKS